MTEEMLSVVMEERDELLSVIRDYRRVILERGTGCNHAGLIEQLQAQLAAQADLLRDLVGKVEGSSVNPWTEDSRERDALRIRAVLGLCRSSGCDNPRSPEPDADGYCRECLEAGE